MKYYEVNTDPTKSPTEEFADLVAFYQSGGKHEEPVKAAPEAPVSRRPSEPVRNTPKPASTPAKTSAPEKPGLLASIKSGFKAGVEKAKRESRSRSD